MGDFSILGIRIKELRSTMKKTQREFAEYVGCTAATLSAYENGSKSPSLEIIKNIAQKCNISIDWLCGLIDEANHSMPRTYADIIKLLVSVDQGIPLSVTEIYGHESHIKLCDDVLSYFLSEWKSIIELYHNGTIDENLYKLWIKDKVKDFEWVHLGVDDDTITFLNLQEERKTSE